MSALSDSERLPGKTGSAPLRVAFLIGADTAATRLTIEQVCRSSAVQPIAVLLDTAQAPLRRRYHNLRRNIEREGVGYAFRRVIAGVRERLDAAAANVIPAREVEELLRRAFPERSLSLHDLAARCGFAVLEPGNLNSARAAAMLRECGADIGVVLGTRILKRGTFSVPPLGCINLHKGKVPEYRGMPPGFWELYDGAASAGVTVHFVDDGLDTGDIVGTCEVDIHQRETPESLRTKLDQAGAALVTECLERLQRGEAEPRPQPASTAKARTRPTRRERHELARRARHLPRSESDLRHILKTAFHLLVWHSGLHRRLRSRKLAPNGRAAIILYHRVNDVAVDPLTTSVRIFAEHLVMLRRHYQVQNTSALVDKIARREYIPPGTVAIHFDDCYRDVYTEAAQLLRAAGLSATAFISSGFIGTDRVFDHDARKYPHRFANLDVETVRGLLDCGLEIGAHTVNHVNLGEIDEQQARYEVVASRRELEAIAARKVDLFSYPFGGRGNIREPVRQMVREAGYRALFSAYGGFASGASDIWDIPRLGASSGHRALDLMIELEGLSVAQIAATLKRLLGQGEPPGGGS